MSKPLRMLALSFLMLFATGCPDYIEESALTADEESNITHLQNPFGQPLVVLSSDNGLPPSTFGMKDCKVYKATFANGVTVGWELVIKPDFSLLPQACDRESIRLEDDYVLVDTGLISFGAGGCCSATGRYRTRDGVVWERYVDGAWVRMADSGAAVHSSISE